MNKAKSYPVFEPDQVLTNKHLNDMFDYLEQHERLTRTKLIGSGIVCGLEVSHLHKNTTIRVSKGCGLTSQGYIITFCETDFHFAVPYDKDSWSHELNFIHQCGYKDDYDDPAPPFYKSGRPNDLTGDPYYYELLTDNKNGNATPLTGISHLKDYVVVLFLEALKEHLKNCDTNDCNDKGSKINFEVKALLVKREIIDLLKGDKQHQDNHRHHRPHLELGRYNVDRYATDLRSTENVLAAFARITNSSVLKDIAELLNYGSSHYHYLLDGDYLTGVEARLNDLRRHVRDYHPILIQYFYDFLDDILKAYYEFDRLAFDVHTSCCGDEMKFPLHLMLGLALEDTRTTPHSDYRQYFIYSPIFNDQKSKLAEVRSLFKRLKMMIGTVHFELSGQQHSTTNYIKNPLAGITITPSRLGRSPLSDRCIPYYYPVTIPGQELYKYWSYDKTRHGDQRYNLGYHSYQYAHGIDMVLHPLRYDLERFNFFRIEGHIGHPVTEALTRVKTIQRDMNLPFDTIALSADFLGALVRGHEPRCIIDDLESDYRRLIAEFICRIHDAFCLVAKIPYPPNTINPVTLEASTTTMIFDAGTILDRVDAASHPYIADVVSGLFAGKSYIKGQLLNKLCKPDVNTVGKTYIDRVGRGEFYNPAGTSDWLSVHAFEFIDTIESVLEMVMRSDLTDLNIDQVRSRLNRVQNWVAEFTAMLTLKTESIEKNMPGLRDRLLVNFRCLSHLCFAEQLQALMVEYHRRMAQYRFEKNFGYYFKKHHGVEHKAGVPTGGTFILVYHEVIPKKQFIDRNLYMGMIDKFAIKLPKLILDNATEDELIRETELLSQALKTQDPDLYRRFRAILKEWMDNCTDLPKPTRDDLDNAIDEDPNKPKYELQNGTVIADFYVPYICCSDCPPVAYILPDKKPDPEKPKGTIEKCWYPLWLSKPGKYPLHTAFESTPPRLTLPDGTIVNVADTFKSTEGWGDINDSGNYDPLFEKLIEQLNKAVTGNNHLIFGYDKANQLLSVEKIKDQSFELFIKGSLTVTTEDGRIVDTPLEATYNGTGLVINYKILGKPFSASMAKFGCAEVVEGSDVTLSVTNGKIITADSGDKSSFSVEEDYASCFWYFSGGMPVYSNEKKKVKDVLIMKNDKMSTRVICVKGNGSIVIKDLVT